MTGTRPMRVRGAYIPLMESTGTERSRAPEYYLFLPQLRMEMPALVARAQAAEAAGFTGLALMDHLAPPLAEDKPMYEAMTLAAWLAAHTTTLRIGHLVLCDSFRSPAVLAREVVTIDHASGGRFDLGIGSGSQPREFATFGVRDDGAKARSRRLAETLEVLRLLWTGERVSFAGEFHRLDGAQHQPVPLGRIPIVVGGSGPTAVRLASQHGDWLNLPIPNLPRAAELVSEVAPARMSIQQVVGYVRDETVRAETAALAERRFGAMPGQVLVGTGTELHEAFAGLHAQGIDRFYVWFTDFAVPETLAAFGRDVIAGRT